MRTLTENDYKVLSKVFDTKNDKGFSRVSASTIEDIKSRLELSDSKVRSAIRTLCEYGFVETGVKKGKKITYYITNEGLKELESLTRKTINIIKGDVE